MYNILLDSRSMALSLLARIIHWTFKIRPVYAYVIICMHSIYQHFITRTCSVLLFLWLLATIVVICFLFPFDMSFNKTNTLAEVDRESRERIVESRERIVERGRRQRQRRKWRLGTLVGEENVPIDADRVGGAAPPAKPKRPLKTETINWIHNWTPILFACFLRVLG